MNNNAEKKVMENDPVNNTDESNIEQDVQQDNESLANDNTTNSNETEDVSLVLNNQTRVIGKKNVNLQEPLKDESPSELRSENSSMILVQGSLIDEFSNESDNENSSQFNEENTKSLYELSSPEKLNDESFDFKTAKDDGESINKDNLSTKNILEKKEINENIKELTGDQLNSTPNDIYKNPESNVIILTQDENDNTDKKESKDDIAKDTENSCDKDDEVGYITSPHISKVAHEEKEPIIQDNIQIDNIATSIKDNNEYNMVDTINKEDNVFSENENSTYPSLSNEEIQETDLDTAQNNGVKENDIEQPKITKQLSITDSKLRFGLQCSLGPFENFPLIKDLPTTFNYTCIESFQGNLYLGTDKGDLIHYFEIEPNTYMIISQTKFNPDQEFPIQKFIFLPELERALVLCNNKLALFLLPEFAPAPNVAKINDVNDITLKSYSKNSKAYSVYVMKDKGINTLRISEKLMISSAMYDFKGITNAVAHESILLATSGDIYEIIDLGKSETIPLFKVSENIKVMPPMIVSFNHSQFLVVSGGTSVDDTAMGLVVDHQGNIVHGTLVLEKYPKSIVYDYPYLFVVFDYKNIQIYNMAASGEPKLEETFEGTFPIHIFKSSKKFTNFCDKHLQEKVSKLLLEVPIVIDGIDYSIEEINDFDDNNETKNSHIRKDILEKIKESKARIQNEFNPSSQLVIYGSIGIQILAPECAVLNFDPMEKDDVQAIKQYIYETKDLPFTPYKEIESTYLMTMRLLSMLVHCTVLEDKIIKKWCAYSKKINILLLFHILNFKIHGDLWCYNGLQEIVALLKEKSLIDYCTNVVDKLKLIANNIKTEKSKVNISNYEDIVKTLDMAYVDYCLKYDISLDMNAYNFEVLLLNDIIKKVEANENAIQDNFLFQLYKSTGNVRKVIQTLRRHKRFNELLDYVESNILEVDKAYSKEELVDDFVEVINQSDKLIVTMIERILTLLTISEIPREDFISKLDNNFDAKVMIFEEMGVEDRKEKNFMIEYYLTDLEKCLKEGNLWESFGIWLTEYSINMNYNKKNLSEYLYIKITTDEKCKKFMVVCEKILKMGTNMNKEDDLEFFKRIGESIQKVDINKLLSCFFCRLLKDLGFKKNNLEHFFITPKAKYALAIEYYDFREVEICLKDSNFVDVLRHYIDTIDDKMVKIEIVSKFMIKNYKYLENKDIMISVFEILPNEIPVKAIFAALHLVPLRYDNKRRQIEMKKSLLKNEIKMYEDILKHFTLQSQDQS